MNVSPMNSLWEGFCENVGDIFGRFDLVDLDHSILNLFVDAVMANINVFHSLVEDIVV